MSWQEYVDGYLMVPLSSGGTLHSAAIAGLDGGLWAHSASFPAATADQLKDIADAFKEENPAIQGSGIKLGSDKKFLVIYYDAGKIFRGKLGNGGLVIKKALTCMVIGIFEEKQQMNDCSKLVENMADYLEQNDL